MNEVGKLVFRTARLSVVGMRVVEVIKGLITRIFHCVDDGSVAILPHPRFNGMF